MACIYVLVQRHPVAQVTPWLLLVPVLAVALGIAFWGDRPGPRLWLGGAMVLGGVLIIALRAHQQGRRPIAGRAKRGLTRRQIVRGGSVRRSRGSNIVAVGRNGRGA